MIEFLRSPRTESSMYHRFKAYIESNPQALRYMNERVGRTLLHVSLKDISHPSASLSRTDLSQYTIKKVGRRYGERQCVRLLLEKGADLMRGDYAGR